MFIMRFNFRAFCVILQDFVKLCLKNHFLKDGAGAWFKPILFGIAGRSKLFLAEMLATLGCFHQFFFVPFWPVVNHLQPLLFHY